MTVARLLNAHHAPRHDGESDSFVVAFTQNSRDEVRLIGGDGSHAGALAAQPGVHQQNYVWHNHPQDGGIRIQGETSPTVVKQWGTGGNNVPFVGVRRLMPIECERLQGFPDGWTDVDGMSDSARYRMLGNAVAVPVADWIGHRIVETIDA